MPREYTVIIEQDEAGYYVGTVPQLHGCHTQARSLDDLLARVREAIQLCVEVGAEEDTLPLELIGVQRVVV